METPKEIYGKMVKIGKMMNASGLEEKTGFPFHSTKAQQ